jgi:DNA-binding response OmpR family regulator
VTRGLEAGAADYFTKPLDIDRLVARLNELTARADRSATLASDPPAATH